MEFYGEHEKRKKRRVRKRRKCVKCGEEYSHSSFYAHKCIADDREDNAFSLQLNPETIGSSSDSEFHISISSDHETDESVTGVNLELQQAQCDYQGDYITSYI